jgi:mannose/cellobiose epimerase-like protein (N-acyl-D-glucosamine 2-epimerase family)
MNTPQLDFRSPEFLLGHIRHTLTFYDRAGGGSGCVDPSGGFFHFYKDDGTLYDRRTRHLVSSTRFVFNHATALRRFGAAERPDDLARVRHGIAFLQQAHAQPQGANGGYAWQIDWDGQHATVQDGTLHCYGLAFVLLAHAHAVMAGASEARAGLDATFELMETHFWEPVHGLYADEATPAQWRNGQVGPYRGQNANMHSCEAMIAAWDATREPRFLQRALTLAESITQRQAALADGLVWEHYRADWSVDGDYNRHDKTNIFRPWGYQVGHLTEWTKLLLQLEPHLQSAGMPVPAWLVPTARHFFDTAMRHGWDDTHGGLVYGFAPGGEVCDADKYFWVQAESFAAAALLALRTGDDRYWQWYDRIWAYAWAHMVDHVHGAWYRIRTPDNRAYSDEKSPAGKTDYHTMGACHDVLRGLLRA